MVNYDPLIAVLILAVVDWIAADRKLKYLEYIAKPATMLALIWFMWVNVGLGGPVLWFTLGAFLCLAGDVFLMLSVDVFIFALVAFLAGHICYVIGFNNVPPYVNLLGVFVIIILAAYLIWLYPRLAKALQEKGRASLRIPVLIYSIVISAMVYSAILAWTRPGWPSMAALSVTLGAVFFFISDSILAWDRFVSAISHARLKTMVTYHLGQVGIILGVVLHLLLK